MLDRVEIIRLTKKLNLPKGDYWVTAGAGLVLHGVKDRAADIDIGCTTKVFDSLPKEAAFGLSSDGTRRAELGGVFEFFENWSVHEVVEIDGVCVASQQSIKKQKAALGRPKDFEDIALINASTK